jgi:hypothetical protein
MSDTGENFGDTLDIPVPDNSQESVEQEDYRDVLSDELQSIEAAEEARDKAMCNALLGATETILRWKVRPVKLAALAMLKKIDSELVSGKQVQDCPDLLIECCRFVVLQRASLSDARSLCENPERLSDLAYELAEEIDPGEVGQFSDDVFRTLNASRKDRVQPIPREGASDGEDALGEG